MRVTSSIVADSIGANAVIVRNLFIDSSKNGLLIASAGKNGGVILAKETKDITFWDIYQSVEKSNVDDIFKIYEGNQDCPVGKNFYQLIYPHMEDSIHAMEESMKQVTIQTLLDELKENLEKL
ncbi:MAG: Rrf2 family transcriptional regulator [Erysipelotrichaceae bacterium]|nr:Rrf2 family transcriptional regulator [Erysipelotrichaceae bacterium]